MLRNPHPFPASIIVPTYNRSPLLELTLQSLTRQSLDKKHFEVIVSDDGSNDATPEVVKKYQPALNLKYCYQEDRGYRPGSARNNGLRHASGEVCIFIDSGVILGSECVAAHLRTHRSHPEEVSVVGYVYGFDQDNAHGEVLKQIIHGRDADEVISYCEQHRAYLDIREACYARYQDAIGELPAPWAFFWTCNASARRRTLLALGGFDPNYDLNWGVEDHDLGYRLHLNRVKFVLNREATAIHYPHDKHVEVKYQQEMVNKRYFHRKYNAPETQLFLNATYQNLNEKLLVPAG